MKCKNQKKKKNQYNIPLGFEGQFSWFQYKLCLMILQIRSAAVL